VSAFLLLAMLCGVVCTCYSLTSCQIVTMDFQSTVGDFDQYFNENANTETTEDTYSVYHVKVGLFTWLRPFDTADWEEGACAGYSDLQREVILDQLFEILRVAGVLGVVIAVSCLFFTLSIACLSFSNVHRYVLIVTAVLISILTGTPLLMTRSGVCTTVGSSPNCTIDQGALVAIVGVACWLLTALVAVFFLQPVHKRKLSPKQLEQRKKDLRKRNLQMLEELEAQELERRVKHQIITPKHRRDRTHQSCHSPHGMVTPPDSPMTQQTSPDSSPERSLSGVPEILPYNKNDTLASPFADRKHRQLESPPVSPVGDEMNGIEAIYQERARPIKKQRLHEEYQQKRLRNNGGSRVETRQSQSNRTSRERRHGVRKYKSDNVIDTHHSDRTKSPVPPKSAALDGREVSRRHLSRSPRGTPRRNASVDNQADIPLYMKRAATSVVNEQEANPNIAEALNNIEALIDDEEQPPPRRCYLQEV